jgi:hypothetical protein
LLRRWLFGCEDFIDLFVALTRYVGQSTSQIVISVGGRIECRRLCLVFLSEIQVKLLALLKPVYKVICRMTLIVRGE